MRSLVTGVAGFIGSTLAEALVDAGDEVVGVDAFLDNYETSRKRANLEELGQRDAFRLVEGHLQDLDLGDLLDGVERVYHLAALPGVRPSWGKAFQEYLDQNVLATQALLEAARDAGAGESGRPRIVYASSSSVYGDTDVLPMREDARLAPYSPYGVTKLAAEHMCRLYTRNFGVPTVAVRYFTVYGPRQRPDMAIQRFLEAAAGLRQVSIFGDGEQSRDFTYVDDAVEATRRAAERGRPGAVYNVGGGSCITVNELLAAIEEVSGREVPARREAAKPGDVRSTRADGSRARRDLDFTPAIPLEEGLRCHWAWLQARATGPR